MPPQSVLTVQEVETQAPLLQTLPEGHWESVMQGPQIPVSKLQMGMDELVQLALEVHPLAHMPDLQNIPKPPH